MPILAIFALMIVIIGFTLGYFLSFVTVIVLGVVIWVASYRFVLSEEKKMAPGTSGRIGLGFMIISVWLTVIIMWITAVLVRLGIIMGTIVAAWPHIKEYLGYLFR